MDYFEKYKQAKFCLYGMIIQFLDIYLSIDDLEMYQIEYSKEDPKYDSYVIGNYLEVCSHNFESEGLLAWDYLGIDKDFITHEELWNRKFNIKNEIIDDSIDYEKIYFKMSILIIDMVTKYYKYNMSLEEAKKNNINFDEEYDEIDNNVLACYHMHESAGESVWNLFDIDDPIVGESVFNNIRGEYSDKLLKKKYEKVKKYKK